MDVTGEELKKWREQRGMSLHDMGQMLGGKTGPTVSRWENGQEIPGDTQLLLKLLIRGEMPFAGVGPVGDPEREAKNFWQLRLTLDDWHRLESLALAAGYDDTKDYILSLIQEDLNGQRGSKVTYPPAKEFLGTGDDLPLAAERASDASSSQDEAQKSLRDAAAAFESVNPPPRTSPIQYSGPVPRVRSKRKP